MFWVGDSSRGWRHWVPLLQKEYKAGRRDGVPLCCAITYMICIMVWMELSSGCSTGGTMIS